VANGLGCAHAHINHQGQLSPIIHRDISPSNILVTLNGDVKINDFGIAKFFESISHTKTGHILGKLHYMAPEYVQGQQVTPPADIFSLGCVFYEMLHGFPLWNNLSTESILAILSAHDSPYIIECISKHIPSQIQGCLLNALVSDPQRRYKNGNEFAKVLSLSLRLFGNVFAGEVLLTVMLGLFAYIVPIPFLFLELLVGVVQATVFAMLTLAYLTVATDEHGHESHEEGEHTHEAKAALHS